MCVCVYMYVCVSLCVKGGGLQIIICERSDKDVQPWYKYPGEWGWRSEHISLSVGPRRRRRRISSRVKLQRKKRTENTLKGGNRWDYRCADAASGSFINSVLSESVCFCVYVFVCVCVSEMAGEVLLASLLFLSATVPCFAVYGSGECFFNTKGEHTQRLNLICKHED